MRVALIYPPPWKIALPGEAAFPSGEGPPADYRDGDLDSDFYQTPYGLFTLGAQAIRAGHQVKVLNLSGFAWKRVEEVIAALDADVFGMSCWTANRRGVAFAARSIKRHHPNAHVIVGGPHATPLGREMLEHYPEIDTIATGESELTFLELLERVSEGRATTGLAGTLFRNGKKIEKGPPRASIHDIDSLASAHDYFDTHIVMTSRGCPWACSFCGAETSWGRGFRGNTVEYTLDALERALARLPVKMIQIKDDTFTTNKKRVLALCRGIRERKLRFLWSCDTRVDVLNEELLYEMRLAGCQRLSLGVESGSQPILDSINKKITVDEIIESSSLAKKYGIQIRYYMMLGNRGETLDTFRQTLEFLKSAKPHQYIFSCLSIFPGTQDFQDAETAGWLNREVYFTGDFQELKTPYDADEEVTQAMSAWFADNNGLRDFYREGVAECRAILERLPDHAPAHMDLAGAYYRDGQFDSAEQHVNRALELDYPLPGLALNYLACIAAQRGELQKMMDLFMKAAKTDPQHHVLIKNVEAARSWFKNQGPVKNLPLNLVASHEFQLLERTAQPSLPGPLPDNFADWSATPTPSPSLHVPAELDASDPTTLERRSTLHFGKRLRVVPE